MNRLLLLVVGLLCQGCLPALYAGGALLEASEQHRRNHEVVELAELVVDIHAEWARRRAQAEEAAAEARRHEERRAREAHAKALTMYDLAVSAAKRHRCDEAIGLVASIHDVDASLDAAIATEEHVARCVWPAMRTDGTTLQYAHQMAASARRGDCPTATYMLGLVAGRDPAYHEALRRTVLVGSCAG